MKSLPRFFAIVGVALPALITQSSIAADRYWSGGSPSGGFDNIDDSRNWFDNIAPTSGDNLYFNNTTGFRHFVNNQKSGGDFFGNFITFNGAGGIRLTGNTTYLFKFENNNDPMVLEATATLSNRTGPDSNLEINPVGSGGVKVANVDIQNGQQLLVYGSNQLEVTGTISQSGTGNASLTINGAKVLLQSASTYAGGTTVHSGTLLANGGVVGASSATGTGIVVVNNSGTLGGVGTISGAVTIASDGILNPGPIETAGTAGAVGTLHTGALTLQSGSFSNFDISGTTTYDQLISSGAIAFGGTLNVNIASGLSFTNGQMLNLFSGTSASTGMFSNAADNQLVTFDGYTFMADYTGTGFTLTAVPEPSTWAAAALALGVVAWTQRRRLTKSLPLSDLRPPTSLV